MYSNNKEIRDVADVAARIMAGLPPLQEKLHPNQQKIDVHEPEKDELTADDFKKLRAGKKPDVKKEEVEQIDELSIGALTKTYDKDVKASPKPHDKEAAAQRAKLAALAARKAMMTNKMSEAESHQSKTTMKHINNPNAAEKKAAKDIKPGIAGVRDRLAMLDAAKKRGALKNEDVDLLSNLYDQLDESNQEIFLNQLEEDAEVLLAFAKTIAEE